MKRYLAFALVFLWLSGLLLGCGQEKPETVGGESTCPSTQTTQTGTAPIPSTVGTTAPTIEVEVVVPTAGTTVPTTTVPATTVPATTVPTSTRATEPLPTETAALTQVPTQAFTQPSTASGGSYDSDGDGYYDFKFH